MFTTKYEGTAELQHIKIPSLNENFPMSFSFTELVYSPKSDGSTEGEAGKVIRREKPILLSFHPPLH